MWKPLKQKQEQDDNQSANKTTSISFPNEIISRLPVKSVLLFRSVSKQWLSLISHDPSFPKLHFNRSLFNNDRSSFFISAFDTSNNEQHFLSAPHDGGPVTHLITLHNALNDGPWTKTEAEDVNGLVFFTSRKPLVLQNVAFVVNPATRKVFEVPPPFSDKHCKYFFGFDESKAEHKILSACCTRNPETIEFMIFSLSTYSWRQIPVDLGEIPPVPIMIRCIKHSVCVNSVIHLMLNHARYEILAFDLSTEKFSSIKLSRGAIPREFVTRLTRHGEYITKNNMPFLIKDNELLGVVCHDHVMEAKEMHIWILQDYVNQVWVRETIAVPESWIEFYILDRIHYGHMASLVFSCCRLSTNMVNACILDMKTKSFKLVNFNLGYWFLHSDTVMFHQVRSYVESILPLRKE